MSRGRKSKRTQAYLNAHLYRHIGEVLNHADKVIGKKPKRGGYGDKSPKLAKPES